MIKEIARGTTIPLPTPKSLKGLGDFYIRQVGQKYLLTNDWGYHTQLSQEELELFVGGRLEGTPLFDHLRNLGFVKGQQDLKDLAQKFKQHNQYLWQGPNLHIIVVTLRCNLKCVYCHSSVVGQNETKYDMTVETAKKVVDFIFSSPNPHLTIEFQGGEAFLNWPVVKFVCEYATKKAKDEKRGLKLLMVSNFTLMDDEKLKFLLDHSVSICTSLDGPPQVHDRNRIHLGGNSHAEVTKWLKKLIDAKVPTGALMTTTRLSLAHGKEIVDEYRRLGMQEVFLRPLHYLGFAKRSWKVIGYEDKEFAEFFGSTMDYILDLNLKGHFFRESSSGMLLRKILLHQDPGYVDLRSPCGATLGQISYNYDGDIYTCDEGRMVGAENDKMFKVGNVNSDDYPSIVAHPTTKACCVASTTDAQPLCQTCTYKPYCGICPVLNQATQNSIWGQMPTNSYCYHYMHVFDYLFEKMQDPDHLRTLQSWVGVKDSIVEPSCAGQI